MTVRTVKISCWQPIETAPVCGEDAPVTAVIAYEDGSVRFDEEFCRGGSDPRAPYDPAEPDPVGIRPTHWLPVPEVPFIHPRFRHEQDQ